MLLSPMGSNERSLYIQYLSRDLRKISVLSRCGLRLINSKTWTFTSLLVCERWAKCLPTQVKGFVANTDGGAFFFNVSKMFIEEFVEGTFCLTDIL